MNLRTEKRLCERAVASGKVTVFYTPPPKPPAPPAVEEPDPGQIPARDVLQQLLDSPKPIRDVMVLLTDSNGQPGFVTNLADVGESVLFMERMKLRILTADQNTPPAPRPA